MGSLTTPVPDNVGLALIIAASLGNDVQMAHVRSRAFPGHGEDWYGYLEIFEACGDLSWTLVDRLTRDYGSLEDFWDRAHDEFAIGVFAYDASNALLHEMGKLNEEMPKEDPETCSDVWWNAEDLQGYYDLVVDRALRYLRNNLVHQAHPLTNQLASILYPSTITTDA